MYETSKTSSMSEDLTVILHFHCMCQQMYREITLPLLLMIQQLQAQKCLLFDLLKKKDAEITEYKLEGAKLSRSKL